ncbi:hypothetical protein Hypma_006944 [Hypsizygus marmoreus]|uniref:Uncharacterized protein n=1 Tax=Hypsizygus marmoreus TaxID=39966 RepID=A0A369K145_HYPMA|nr:hypothetical protein Hypma_006944 [Hypsizygus marmoreus]
MTTLFALHARAASTTTSFRLFSSSVRVSQEPLKPVHDSTSALDYKTVHKIRLPPCQLHRAVMIRFSPPLKAFRSLSVSVPPSMPTLTRHVNPLLN